MMASSRYQEAREGGGTSNSQPTTLYPHTTTMKQVHDVLNTMSLQLPRYININIQITVNTLLAIRAQNANSYTS